MYVGAVVDRCVFGRVVCICVTTCTGYTDTAGCILVIHGVVYIRRDDVGVVVLLVCW